MKRYFAILFLFFISFGCTQKPARIIYKNAGVYKPTYSETYVESPDGKLARSLRGSNDSSKAQEIDIINKDNVPSNDIMEPRIEVINALKQIRDNVYLILWTCRDDISLDNAIKFCKKHRIIR